MVWSATWCAITSSQYGPLLVITASPGAARRAENGKSRAKPATRRRGWLPLETCIRRSDRLVDMGERHYERRQRARRSAVNEAGTSRGFGGADPGEHYQRTDGRVWDCLLHAHRRASDTRGEEGSKSCRPRLRSAASLGSPAHGPGKSFLLGATLVPGGANFSVFAKRSTAVQLLLLDDTDAPKPSRVIDLDPRANRIYHYWRVFVPGVTAGEIYAYRVAGRSIRRGGCVLTPRRCCSTPTENALLDLRGAAGKPHAALGTMPLRR
jgi:hypothetical protein